MVSTAAVADLFKHIKTGLVINAIGLAIAAPLTVYAQPSYLYEAVAVEGQTLAGTQTIINLGSGPSINDAGKVAFIARDEAGIHGRVMVSNHGQIERNFQTPPTERVGTDVQINNSDHVVWWRQIESPGSQLDGDTAVLRLETSQGGSIIAQASGFFVSDFNYVLPWASLNNQGLAVFTADLSTGGTVLASRNGGSGPYEMSPAIGGFPNFFPMVSDDMAAWTSRTVIRAGNAINAPIKVFVDPTLDPVQALDVATSTEFTAIGSKPGISDDGRVVVFLANSITEGAGVYMAAINNASNSAVRFKLADITAGSNPALPMRVGVNQVKDMPYHYNVVYIANTVDGNAALFTTSVDVTNPYTPIVTEAPHTIVESGKPIDLIINTPLQNIVNIGIYDPVNNRNEFVFWVEDEAGTEAIVKASPCVDTDKDALCDEWETNGIKNYNGDTVLDLQALGADPYRKDIFVEIDYMDCTLAGSVGCIDTHNHRPSDESLVDVVDAFAAAPVFNTYGREDGGPPGSCADGIDNGGGDAMDENDPDCYGITLHLLPISESIPEMEPMIFADKRGPEDWDDFDDIKLGVTADGNANPCGSGANVGYFGNAVDRQAANCGEILAAKRMVYHYVVFGHSLGASNSGRGETPGNDFVVTLGGKTQAQLDAGGGLNDWESGTLMHELGHNLGLRHGGGDPVNCKPNYISVMNYLFQLKHIITNRKLDYSRSNFPSGGLNENSLNENEGLQGPAGLFTAFGQPVFGNPQVQRRVAIIAADQKPVDFNGDGLFETAVDSDISNLPLDYAQCGAGYTELHGYDDWNSLVYNFRKSIYYLDGVTRNVNADPEITGEAVEEAANLVDFDADGFVNNADNCPSDANSEQIDTDGDNQGDVCDVDDDGDGMPDIWEINYGLDPLDATDATQDPDGDGITNIDEYRNGTDPNVNDIPVIIPALSNWAAALLMMVILLIQHGFATRSTKT